MNEHDGIEAAIDREHGRCVVGGEPLIFHCHHYNVYLQRTIEEDAQDVESRPFMVGAAASVAYHQLRAVFAQAEVEGREARAALASRLYGWQGFGRVDLSGVGPQGGVAEAAPTHYALGWRQKLGPAQGPVGGFTAGWVVGAAAAIHDLAPDALDVAQVACEAMGAASSRFEVRRAQPRHAVFESVGVGALGSLPRIEEPATPVDRAGVRDAVLGMGLAGDERGLMPAFGVYLTRHFANYYCRISFELVRALEAQFGPAGRQVAEPLLIEAGRVCAFHTFGGVMQSSEWDALIRPSLETDEDWVHGMMAVVNAFGWGTWQVEAVGRDGARFVLHDDYESVAWRAMYGEAAHPVSYLAMGGVEGLLSLVYEGEVSARPTLDPALYRRLFVEPRFTVHSEASLAMGDAATILRVERG